MNAIDSAASSGIAVKAVTSVNPGRSTTSAPAMPISVAVQRRGPRREGRWSPRRRDARWPSAST